MGRWWRGSTDATWSRQVRRVGVGVGMAVTLAAALGAQGAVAGGAPSLAFSPAPFSFGTIANGATASKTLTLTNTGGSASASLVITLPGASAFRLTADGCTGRSLGPGKSCSVTVTYSPTSDGANDSATLTATGDKAGATATDKLSGATPGKADLSVTVDDGTTSVAAGAPTTYTVTVANAGPNAVQGAKLASPLPAGAASASWTATASGGATGFSATGTGAILDTINLPSESSVTYTWTVVVVPSATGTLAASASIAPPAGVNDPNPANNTAGDSDTITVHGDLGVTISDGVSSVAAGTASTYTIVVSNAGPSDVSGAAVTTSLPLAVGSATYTATASGGASGFSASGSGAIHDTVTLPAGSSITYSLNAPIKALSSGQLSVIASVSPPAGASDPNPANNTAADTDSITSVADFSITNDDGAGSVNAGGSTTYTIVVSNAGPSYALGASVVDALPAQVSSDTWTATATGGANGFSSVGSGAISDTVDLPPGSAITYALTANVDPTATGNLVATATVAPAAGTTDPNPANDSATDTDSVISQADHLVITGVPLSLTAGSAQDVIVTALDASHHFVPGYTGTVHFSSTDAGATLPADYTFTAADAGHHMFTGGVTFVTAGTQTVTATDTSRRSVTGSETTVVAPAAAAALTVSGLTSPAAAGAAQTITVTAQDSFGNVATGYLGTVHFSSTDAGSSTVLPADYTFTAGDAGSHTFAAGVTLTTPGSQTVTATDTAQVLTGSESVTVQADTVTLQTPHDQTTTVGSAVNLSLSASDSGGLPLTFSATGLPNGLSINSATGVISGTPTASGSNFVTVHASDSTGASDTVSFLWTVLPVGGSCTGQQLLGNPGFETGSASPWATTSGVINKNGDGELAHSGSWYAWLNGYGTTHTDTLSQTVFVPVGCTTDTLSFWLHINTAETSPTTAFDTMKVTVNSTTIASFSNLNHNLGYALHTYNVSAFAGQAITLKFTGTEDASLQTSFVIDDTALNVS